MNGGSEEFCEVTASRTSENALLERSINIVFISDPVKKGIHVFIGVLFELRGSIHDAMSAIHVCFNF